MDLHRLIKCAAFALTAVFLMGAGQYYLPPQVDSASATTWVQDRLLDTSADGTGDPQPGMCYFDTTLYLELCWDDVAVAWQDPDVNSAHALGNGSDHANVALNDGHRALVAGNPHAVTAIEAGADPAGTAAAGDGAHLGAFTHGDIATMAGSGVQAVGAGDAPNLAIDNMTGDGGGLTHIDADDVDLVTVPSGNCLGDTTADECLATLDAASLGGGGGSVYQIDMGSGGDDHDWKTTATDPTSGLVCSGDCADFTTLGRTGGTGIVFDVAAAKTAYLNVAVSSGVASLLSAGEVTITAEVSLTNLDGSGDRVQFSILDVSSGREAMWVKIEYNGANRLVGHSIKRLNVWSATPTANVANWASANSFMWQRRGADATIAGHSTAALVEPAAISIKSWSESDGDGFRASIGIIGVAGGRVAGTIHNIWIGGVPVAFTP